MMTELPVSSSGCLGRGGPFLDLSHRHQPILVPLFGRFEARDQALDVAAAFMKNAAPRFVDFFDNRVVDHSITPGYWLESSSGVTMTGVGRRPE
jgi:hypothetical protein